MNSYRIRYDANAPGADKQRLSDDLTTVVSAISTSWTFSEAGCLLVTTKMDADSIEAILDQWLPENVDVSVTPTLRAISTNTVDGIKAGNVIPFRRRADHDTLSETPMSSAHLIAELAAAVG
ncbi:MAG: hypothetical protein AAFY64_00585 [Pseudomonadota bacterium]